MLFPHHHRVRGPYAGQRICFTSMHAKEKVVCPVFESWLGCEIVVAADIDTDRLGTFTGEVPRPSRMLQTAIAKARLGMTAMNLSIGLASEGAYGPDPAFPLVPTGMELLVLVDDEQRQVIADSFRDDKPCFDHIVVSQHDNIDGFLHRIRFPEHAVVVSANDARTSPHAMTKGVVSHDELQRAIDRASTFSRDSRAIVQTDMRAKFNPTRMRAIERAAQRLVRRVLSICPACEAPGFGFVEYAGHLPCIFCGNDTILYADEIFGCDVCGFKQCLPRSDEKAKGEQSFCLVCNP